MVESRGDEALSDLVRQRGLQLTGYAYLLTGDVAAAQDLVQDALIRVFLRTRAGFTPEVAEAYVRRSIMGLYVDSFRRRRRWALLRRMVATAEVGEESELSTADRMDLRTALATLAPQERACVVLRFYEDMTIAEIAEQMRLAPGTVKRYLSNAIRKLQVRLGPVAVPKEGESIAFAPLPLAGTGAPPVRSSGSPSGGRS